MERAIFNSLGAFSAAEVSIEGPPLQIPLISGTVSSGAGLGVNLAGTVAGSGTINSALVRTYGMPSIAIGLTSSQNGVLQVQRFIDPAGSIANGPALTVPLTAATAGVLLNNDNRPFTSMRVSVINAGTAVGTITNFAGLLQSR